MMTPKHIAAIEKIETAFFSGMIPRNMAIGLLRLVGFSEREAAAMLYVQEL